MIFKNKNYDMVYRFLARRKVQSLLHLMGINWKENQVIIPKKTATLRATERQSLLRELDFLAASAWQQ